MTTDDDDDAPEAWEPARNEAELFRRDAMSAERWAGFCRWVVDGLLMTLRPEDARRHLFTATEIRRFRLRRH